MAAGKRTGAGYPGMPRPEYRKAVAAAQFPLHEGRSMIGTTKR